MSYYSSLRLGGIRLNLAAALADRRCLPTGGAGKAPADVRGRLARSERRVEVEARMNPSDKCRRSAARGAGDERAAPANR